MDSDTATGWLQLLLHDRPWSTLIRHRAETLQAARGADRDRREADADAAFELCHLLDQRRERAAELSALNDIAMRLTTVRDRDTLVQLVVDQARSLLNVDLAYLGTVEDDQFVVNVTSGALTKQIPGTRFAVTHGMAGLVIRTGAPAWTQDYQAEPTFRHVTGGDSAAAAENMRGLLGVPLRVGDQVLGALFACKRSERRFTDSEIALLGALAAHAAIAIDNAQSFDRYRRAVEHLESANAELSARTDQLERSQQWDRTLTNIVLRGAGVPELLGEVSRLLSRTVHLVSQDDPLSPELAPVADDIAAVLSRFTQGSGIDVDYVVRPTERGALVGRRVPPTAGGVACALVVDCDSPTGLPNSDQSLLDRAVPAVSLLRAADHYAGVASQRARDAFVVDLLTQPPESDDESSRRFRLAGLKPDQTYCVAVAVAVTGEGEVNPRGVFTTATLPDGTAIARHGSRAVAVVPADDAATVLAAVRVGEPTVTVGVSEPTVGVAGLAAAYTEAQQTCHVLSCLGRRGNVSTSGGLGIYRILLSHTGRQQVNDLVENTLGVLYEEQRKRGTPLVDTLAVYLGNNRRHAESAAQLNVHPNTLYQRLDTIDRIVGVQWRDPDYALDLQVLLKLQRGAVLLQK